MLALKYHQATFDLLERIPVLLRANVNALDAREKVLNVRFPASVREWYSISGTVEILRVHSNQDHFFEISELGNKWDYDEEIDDAAQYENYANPNLCPFMIENQAVIQLAFCLDGSDDPSVYVWNDSGSWVLCDEDFSQFIYNWIRDFLQ